MPKRHHLVVCLACSPYGAPQSCFRMRPSMQSRPERSEARRELRRAPRRPPRSAPRRPLCLLRPGGRCVLRLTARSPVFQSTPEGTGALRRDTQNAGTGPYLNLNTGSTPSAVATPITPGLSLRLHFDCAVAPGIPAGTLLSEPAFWLQVQPAIHQTQGSPTDHSVRLCMTAKSQPAASSVAIAGLQSAAPRLSATQRTRSTPCRVSRQSAEQAVKASSSQATRSPTANRSRDP